MSASGSLKDVYRELTYAYENVKFFREHMKKSGLLPEDIKTLTDFKSIPITHKQHYRCNYPSGVLAAGFTLNGPHVMRFQSSGTSGERLNSAALSYDLVRRQATAMSVNANFNALWHPGSRPRVCRYAPPNCSDVECGIGLTAMEERILPDGTLVLPVAHDLLATPLRMINQALDEISSYNPDILVVDPTHLAFLIRTAGKLGRKIVTTKKLHIICGYTHFTQIARRQIRHFFGDETPIGNMLGMSELGYLGFECHHGHLHINNQDFFLEFLNGEKEAVLNEAGELVISTIDDGLIPRIRYATGDLYCLLSKPCTCGSALPLVTIEGRATHIIRGKNGTIVTPAEVDLAVGDCPDIDLYKLEQDEKGNLRFRYILNQTSSSELTTLQQRLRALFQTHSIIFEAVDYIACERSGKFQSCISRYHGASF